MKLIKCLELGEECGLTTVIEALRNVDIHASSLFVYDKIDYECDELIQEYEDILLSRGFNQNSSITEVIDIVREVEEEREG